MNRITASSWIGIALMALSFTVGMGLVACGKVGDGVGVNEYGAIIVAAPIDSCTLPIKPARCVDVDSCTRTPKPLGCPSEGPSFAADIEPILTASCGTCHIPPNGTGYSYTKLSLTKADAYDSLVNKPSFEMAGIKKPMMRVLPGKPDSSFLYLKISMNTPPGNGQRMPLGVPLTADKIELIKTWIATGAKP